MSPEFDKDRLVHYFAGECSDEEKARIEAWIEADPLRRQEAEALRRLWEAAGRQPAQSWNLDAMWKEVERRLETDAVPSGRRRRARSRPASRKARRGMHRRRARRQSSRRRFRAVAALLMAAVVAFAAAEVFDGLPGGREEPRVREIATAAGERAKVRLEGGTRILLGPKSTLVLPEEFAPNVREVRLEGKAYFEVAFDDGRPFVVRAGGATARVLGTKFSVEAYPGGDAAEVVVAEGKVAMYPEQAECEPEQEEDELERAESEKGVVLTRGQMGRLSKETEQVVRWRVDLRQQLAWTEGRLVFTDASFEEVTEQLARYYGLKVKLAAPPAEVDRLNATFGDEPVEVILGVIAKTLGLRYERDGRVVTFYPLPRQSPHAP